MFCQSNFEKGWKHQARTRSQLREFEQESTNFRSSGTNLTMKNYFFIKVVNIVTEYYTTVERVRAARLNFGLRADLRLVQVKFKSIH